MVRGTAMITDTCRWPSEGNGFGRNLDAACPSGGMFVSSARFVGELKKNPTAELSIHGVEKTDETGRLCRLSLAVHGLEGDIRHGGNVNSYYYDPLDATGRFDFVLAKAKEFVQRGAEVYATAQSCYKK